MFYLKQFPQCNIGQRQIHRSVSTIKINTDFHVFNIFMIIIPPCILAIADVYHIHHTQPKWPANVLCFQCPHIHTPPWFIVHRNIFCICDTPKWLSKIFFSPLHNHHPLFLDGDHWLRNIHTTTKMIIKFYVLRLRPTISGQILLVAAKCPQRMSQTKF